MVGADEDGGQLATPRYNTAVLQDLVQVAHTDHGMRLLQESQNVRDGIALLKVWLRQRQLDTVRSLAACRGDKFCLLLSQFVLNFTARTGEKRVPVLHVEAINSSAVCPNFTSMTRERLEQQFCLVNVTTHEFVPFMRRCDETIWCGDHF